MDEKLLGGRISDAELHSNAAIHVVYKARFDFCSDLSSGASEVPRQKVGWISGLPTSKQQSETHTSSDSGTPNSCISAMFFEFLMDCSWSHSSSVSSHCTALAAEWLDSSDASILLHTAI